MAFFVASLVGGTACSWDRQAADEAPAQATEEFEEQVLEDPELQIESPPPSAPPAASARPDFSRLSGDMTAPEQTVAVTPTYPERGAPCRPSSRTWIGEIDIDEAGDVADVRTIEPIRCDPRWPEWEEAIPAAIRQWKYEPATRAGQPVPVKITVRIAVGEASEAP